MDVERIRWLFHERTLPLAVVMAMFGLGLLPSLSSAETLYEQTVQYGASGWPVIYLRLGDPAGASWANNVNGPPGGFYGRQVVTGRPGAIAGDPDTSAEFLGGVADGVWESRIRWDDLVGYAASGRTSFSLEAWAKPTQLHDSARRIFSSEDASGGYLLAARRSGFVFARYTKAGTHPFWAAGGTAPSNRTVPTQWNTVSGPARVGAWTHVVAVYDGHTMRLYLNGLLVDSVASRFDLAYSAPTLGIASTTAGWLEWDGGLDELAWYGGYAVSAEDVRRHHHVGTTGALPGAQRGGGAHSQG